MQWHPRPSHPPRSPAILLRLPSPPARLFHRQSRRRLFARASSRSVTINGYSIHLRPLIYKKLHFTSLTVVPPRLRQERDDCHVVQDLASRNDGIELVLSSVPLGSIESMTVSN